jgi:hypothetical protein
MLSVKPIKMFVHCLCTHFLQFERQYLLRQALNVTKVFNTNLYRLSLYLKCRDHNARKLLIRKAVLTIIGLWPPQVKVGKA